MSSLRALRRKVPLKPLPEVQPIFLLHALIGFSQTLNSSAVQLEALARALITDGQQRLRGLRDAAPHLHLPLEQVLEIVRSKDDNGEGSIWTPSHFCYSGTRTSPSCGLGFVSSDSNAVLMKR